MRRRNRQYEGNRTRRSEVDMWSEHGCLHYRFGTIESVVMMSEAFVLADGQHT
jgi:hypothetical protein